jgi:hypothetical protein
MTAPPVCSALGGWHAERQQRGFDMSIGLLGLLDDVTALAKVAAA